MAAVSKNEYVREFMKGTVMNLSKPGPSTTDLIEADFESIAPRDGADDRRVFDRMLMDGRQELRELVGSSLLYNAFVSSVIKSEIDGVYINDLDVRLYEGQERVSIPLTLECPQGVIDAHMIVSQRSHRVELSTVFTPHHPGADVLKNYSVVDLADFVSDSFAEDDANLIAFTDVVLAEIVLTKNDQSL
jgi:hypothetical protein